MSIIAGVLIFILVVSEVTDYLSSRTRDHMVVDKSFDEKLVINMDISFLALSCRGTHHLALPLARAVGMQRHACVCFGGSCVSRGGGGCHGCVWGAA